jgi:hypothetical protein
MIAAVISDHLRAIAACTTATARPPSPRRRIQYIVNPPSWKISITRIDREIATAGPENAIISPFEE